MHFMGMEQARPTEGESMIVNAMAITLMLNHPKASKQTESA